MSSSILLSIFIMFLTLLEYGRRRGTNLPLVRSLTFRQPRRRRQRNHDVASDESQESSCSPITTESEIRLRRVTFNDARGDGCLTPQMLQMRTMHGPPTQTAAQVSFSSSIGGDSSHGTILNLSSLSSANFTPNKPPTRGRRLGEKMFLINTRPQPPAPISISATAEEVQEPLPDYTFGNMPIPVEDDSLPASSSTRPSSTWSNTQAARSASSSSPLSPQDTTSTFTIGQQTQLPFQSQWTPGFVVRNENAQGGNEGNTNATASRIWDFEKSPQPHISFERGGVGKNMKRERGSKKGPVRTMRRAVARLGHHLTKMNESDSDEMDVCPTTATLAQSQLSQLHNHQGHSQSQQQLYHESPPQLQFPSVPPTLPLFTFGGTGTLSQQPVFKFDIEEPTFFNTDRVPTPIGCLPYKGSLRRRLESRVFGPQKQSGPRFAPPSRTPPATPFHAQATNYFFSNNSNNENYEHAGSNDHQFSFSQGSMASSNERPGISLQHQPSFSGFSMFSSDSLGSNGGGQEHRRSIWKGGWTGRKRERQHAAFEVGRGVDGRMDSHISGMEKWDWENQNTKRARRH